MASTNEQGMLPAALGLSPMDPLVSQAAGRLADVINHFKRELDKRDRAWASVCGQLELAFDPGQSYTYKLVVSDENGAQFPVAVQLRHKTRGANNELIHHASSSSSFKPTRRDSDAELEKDIVSRKKRKLDTDNDVLEEQVHLGGDEHIITAVTKEDLEGLLSKLREDIQEDTSECINHVQRLLRRFKEEWHEKSKWDDERQTLMRQYGVSRRESTTEDRTQRAPFPSADVAVDDPELIEQKANLISSQINQNLLLQKSTLHTQMLNSILDEVNAIMRHTQAYKHAMKWETPGRGSLFIHPSDVPTPAPLAFPTEPAPTGTRLWRSRDRGSSWG